MEQIQNVIDDAVVALDALMLDIKYELGVMAKDYTEGYDLIQLDVTDVIDDHEYPAIYITDEYAELIRGMYERKHLASTSQE